MGANLGGVIGGFVCDNFPLLGMARSNMVRGVLKDARSTNCTHMLFLDTDVVIGPDVPQRLLAHGRSIVSALYFERRFPYRGVYRYKDGEEGPLPGTVPVQGLLPVELLGFGCVLIDLAVLRAMEDPWFVMEKVGEDFHFCRKAREKGFSMFVDCATEVQHVGTVPIGRAEAYALSRIKPL